MACYGFILELYWLSLHCGLALAMGFIINDKRENYNSFLYSVNDMCPCTNLLDMVLSKVDWVKVGPHTHASLQHIKQNPISHKNAKPRMWAQFTTIRAFK